MSSDAIPVSRTSADDRPTPAVEHATPDAAARYANFGKGVPELTRHPEDGWISATPFPMGAPARNALRGLVRILCPPAPAPQLPDLEDRIEQQARVLMRYMPLPVAWLLRLLFRALDQAPRLLFMSRRRLHTLDTDAARRVIHRLAASSIAPVREMVGAARSLILSIYFDQDEVHAALGYRPIPFMRDRIGLRSRLLAGAPSAPNDIIPPTPGLEA